MIEGLSNVPIRVRSVERPGGRDPAGPRVDA